MKKIEKPWGYEIIIVSNEYYTGKILHIVNKQQTSKQYHKEKHETLFLTKGKAEVLSNGLTKIIDADKDSIEDRTIIIPPHTIHMTKAIDGDCEFTEVSTSQLEDVVRLSDIYQRID